MSYQLAKSSGVEAFTVGASALTEGSHVKLTASLLVVAGASDVGVGVILHDAAAGEQASVALFGTGEIAFVLAHDNAITAGQKLVAAASGRFDGGAATGTYVGVALEDSTAQGHLIKAVLGVPSATVA
jgi:hypothetical protein